MKNYELLYWLDSLKKYSVYLISHVTVIAQYKDTFSYSFMKTCFGTR